MRSIYDTTQPTPALPTFAISPQTASPPRLLPEPILALPPLALPEPDEEPAPAPRPRRQANPARREINEKIRARRAEKRRFQEFYNSLEKEEYKISEIAQEYNTYF